MKYGDALTTLAQVVFPPGDTNNMTFEVTAILWNHVIVWVRNSHV